MKNREIKFRAFIEGEMLGADVLAFEEYGLLQDQLGSCPTLMQFTGLKDKNGVEIYECDIVKATHRTKGSIYIGSIQMPKSCWVIELTNEIKQKRWYRTAEFERFEIIGNIYEHPHKLTPNS